MNEQQARAFKVDRLLEALVGIHGSDPAPEVVRAMSDDAWAHLETLAGTKPASAETREQLAWRLELRASLKDADPFDCFPTPAPDRTPK